MQLLSVIDARTAVADVQNVRMAQFPNFPPEFQGVFPGFVPAPPGSTRPIGDTPSAQSSTSPEPTGSTSAGSSTVGTKGAVAAAVAGSGDESGDASVQKYVPIIIGLLSANLFVVLVLAAVGLGLYIKRSGTTRKGSRYTPVKLKEGELLGNRPETYDAERRYSD
jgi:hypothetical protein